jgi:hypothetical protein
MEDRFDLTRTRQFFTSGEEIEILGDLGVLVAITPIQTLIEKKGQILSIPNQAFLESVVKR